MELDIKMVKLEVPEDCNLILGQSHFIKTVEDLYEAIVNTVPQAEFGLSFGEASGDCKVRTAGNNEELKNLAGKKMLEMACGHSFLIFLRNAFPINLTQRIKDVPEVVNLFCATANPVQVLIVESKQGRGIIGVIDGFKPSTLETEEDIAWRQKFLRDIGYKL
ncbi:adenosine-specific kinase [Methanobacterium petrolearium]|uniref:adenosine-specific kinase n=1 Tax=Methanobacterium petrolearium TaxID=710190 RepID=UPI001AE84A1F|nr:adenosine-specific kinase [Methanobacterium petrolearium]MBP1945024.1 adenosine/AMP kinase [Methanobacterium petrolearium]BDZ70350.1 membrane protein [Methanobacterium petrolearium]